MRRPSRRSEMVKRRKKMTRKRPAKDPRAPETYDTQRGDVSMWSPEPVQAKVVPAGTVVFSMRLSVRELEEVRRIAASCGTTVSDFIRTATATASQSQAVRIVMLG